jgi:hypothetical protein
VEQVYGADGVETFESRTREFSYLVDPSPPEPTGYGLDGPGIESRWGRDFSHTSTPALGPTQPPVQWVPGISRGLSDRGVVLTTHPLTGGV